MKFRVNLCDEFSCTQCFACQQVCPKNCITRKEVGAGFYIPEIDRDTCIECGACISVCHKLNQKIVYQKPLHAYACWTTSLSDREHSSSGGAFSVIAHKVLEEGGVVYGATMDDSLKVKHIVVDNEDDIRKLQGSKYLQSEISSTLFREIKKNLSLGKKVLFTGTPCQVSGLYSFLRTKPQNLLTCDLVCHGVPSQKAFDVYVDKINVRKNTREITFRFTKGWGYQMARRINSSKGNHKRLISPEKAYYIRAFDKGLMFNESCYSCPYSQQNRVGDITIADYWGLGTIVPFNHPTIKGISLILVNNENGMNFISRCSDLYKEERPIEEAIQGNGNLHSKSIRPTGRDTYYEDSMKLPYKSLVKKYNIKANLRDYLRILKQIINTFR